MGTRGVGAYPTLINQNKIQNKNQKIQKKFQKIKLKKIKNKKFFKKLLSYFVTYYILITFAEIIKNMTWNNLNIADKSRIIKLAVESGLTNLDTIQQVYNKKFATGGSTDPTDPPEGSNSEDLTTNYLPIVSNLSAYHNNEPLQLYRNPRIPTGIYSNDSNVPTSLYPNLSDDIQPGDWAQIDNLPTANITAKRPQQRYTEGLSSSAQIPNIDALQLYKDTQKFLNDNPSFWRNTSSFDVLNTVTGGALNWTIPSQMFGNLVNLGDAAINNGSYDEFTQGFVNGNRGIGELAESLSDKHPYWTLGLNLLGDTFAFNPRLRRLPYTVGKNSIRFKFPKVDEFIVKSNNPLARTFRTVDDLVYRPSETFKNMRNGTYQLTNRGIRRSLNSLEQDYFDKSRWFGNVGFENMDSRAQLMVFRRPRNVDYQAYHSGTNLYVPGNKYVGSNIPYEDIENIMVHEIGHNVQKNFPDELQYNTRINTGKYSLPINYTYPSGKRYGIYDKYNSVIKPLAHYFKKNAESTKRRDYWYASANELDSEIYRAQYRAGLSPTEMLDENQLKPIIDKFGFVKEDIKSLKEVVNNIINNRQSNTRISHYDTHPIYDRVRSEDYNYFPGEIRNGFK